MGKQVAARLKQKNYRISGVDINKRLNSDEIAGMKFLLPDDCSNSQKNGYIKRLVNHWFLENFISNI